MIWYAFRVEPQKEFAAEQVLKRAGYRVFVPIEKKWIRRTRGAAKAHEKTYPLCVGYIWVGFEHSFEWPQVFRYTALVKSIVGFGGYPAAFTDRAMQSLRNITAATIAHHQSVNTRKSYAQGDLVIINKGPLRGSHCVVEDVKGQRARVVFAMLGCDAIEVKTDSLEAA